MKRHITLMLFQVMDAMSFVILLQISIKMVQ